MQQNNLSQHATPCDIGFIGLGVMGKSLVLNLADNGYKIAAFDLVPQKIDELLTQDKIESGGGRVVGCNSYTELLSKLTEPHLIILSIPAGDIVDDVCHKLIDAGIKADDIVIDTGNSLWTDSVKREKDYDGQFLFFSSAVSGGEVGARFGPSLMPSGDPYAWTRIEPIWQAIAAKVDPDTGKPIERFEPGNPVKEGEPCTCYIGPSGAGHYVKMVHNGIEYADMQLIGEAYHMMRVGLNMTPKEIAAIFRQWDQGVLESYLINISAEVLEMVDDETQLPLVDIILDKAGQKGTGLWTAVSSLEIGCPAPTITSAVYARSLSMLKDERKQASQKLSGPEFNNDLLNDKDTIVRQLHDALYCAKICTYAQGFQLMEMASSEHQWSLNFAEIASIWRAGCIIRAVFLRPIIEAYQQQQDLPNLLLAPFFSQQINACQENWRKAIVQATMCGIPCGALSSALAYYDSYRSEVLPANLLQGQRDYFGAHTFERVDKKAGKKYHVEWSQLSRNIVEVS